MVGSFDRWRWPVPRGASDLRRVYGIAAAPEVIAIDIVQAEEHTILPGMIDRPEPRQGVLSAWRVEWVNMCAEARVGRDEQHLALAWAIDTKNADPAGALLDGYF
jgi:hypothetical protein